MNTPIILPNDHPIIKACGDIAQDIRAFIELSIHEDDGKWEDWLKGVVKESQVRCWVQKGCHKTTCAAYENTDGRCWLIAGTMCGGSPQGEFALKYKNCTGCDVYQDAVYEDPVIEIYEHLITLVHNLKSKHDRMKTMATRDTLTGLFNRNYFGEVIEREMHRAIRYQERLSLMLIDLDNFKYINDTYGHLHGDGILREFAGILERSVRSSDLLCRYGGDEFIIVSPKNDCPQNDTLTGRINDNLQAWNETYASDDYRLSCSIGCTSFNKDKSLAEVIGEADRMMFEHKNSKRKCN